MLLPKKESEVMVTLRILTLNCWGIPLPIVCKYRSERFVAIGEEVARQNYDVVIFCEVWLKSNYKTLCEKISPTMPHTHYFYSGFVGSGLCVFSRYPIKETVFHLYSLNGYAHRVQHGDWYAAKGVGLCKLDIKGLRVNVYCSHVHAEYIRDQDEYYSHRTAQCFELSQFVQLTSESCDLVLIGGDLNVEPCDLGYHIVRTYTNVQDCWCKKKRTCGYEHGNTDSVPCNSFVNELKGYPEGKRIDYWLYRANGDWRVSVEECSVAMNQIPGRPYNYSDHEALVAVLQVQQGETIESSGIQTDQRVERDKHLTAAVSVLDEGLHQTERDQSFFQIQVLVLSVLLFFLEVSGSPSESSSMIGILLTLKLILTLGLAFCVWTGFVVKRIEVHGYQAIMANIVNVLETSAREQAKSC